MPEECFVRLKSAGIVSSIGGRRQALYLATSTILCKFAGSCDESDLCGGIAVGIIMDSECQDVGGGRVGDIAG